MCSIAGAPQGIDSMLLSMKHRAPDGIFVRQVRPDYQLGMGLLSITGASLVLPLNKDEYTLTFNGEIYNYKELKTELKALGHKFEGDSDSEVLLHAYMEWGADCLDKLNGMFSFAIYDSIARHLFFARDIAGEKPFYYQKRQGSFFFASENKALHFQGMELPHAHCGVYTFETGELKIWKWWNFVPYADYSWTLEKAVEHLNGLLGHAVALRIPQKHYALYRSGGVDSTLIASYLPTHSSLSYKDMDYSDEFTRDFRRVVWHLDSPIDSFSAYPLWRLAESAKNEGIQVVISGEGADELFEGYVRYAPNSYMLQGQGTFPSYKSMFPYDPLLGWKDFNGKMQGLLRMGDRMAAAHGLENRCPFLDRRIIEFAFSLPPHLRAEGGRMKIVLAELLKRRVPEYVFGEKHGLFASVNKWLGVSDPLNKEEYLKSQWKIYQEFR